MHTLSLSLSPSLPFFLSLSRALSLSLSLSHTPSLARSLFLSLQVPQNSVDHRFGFDVRVGVLSSQVGSRIICKLTRWRGGTNPSTLEWLVAGTSARARKASKATTASGRMMMTIG